jgi:hypothetical protein
MGDASSVYVRHYDSTQASDSDTWVADDVGTRVTQAVVIGLFMFIGAIFLINLFIAVLNVEYSKLAGSARWRSEQAVMIFELQVFELFLDPQARWLYVSPSSPFRQQEHTCVKAR